ncbi:hypothetical protein KY329_02080 [Candidatus Woesearchaeota archaeon]|nr:hypothetical protein [Candidatus Woesearchaeota archaeon]
MQRGAEHAYVSSSPEIYSSPSVLRVLPQIEPKEWDPNLPLSEWDPDIADIFRSHAGFLLDELYDKKPVTRLVPLDKNHPRWHFEDQKRRLVEVKNPDWFRKLYADTPWFERRRSCGALERIATGIDNPTTEYTTTRTIWRPPKGAKYYNARIKSPLWKPAIPRTKTRIPKKVIVKSSRNGFEAVYRNLIFEHLTEGFVDLTQGEMPPILEVCTYFGHDAENAESILGDTSDVELIEFLPF